MIGRVVENIPVALDARALMKQLHIEPDSGDGASFMQWTERARTVARPKALFAECFVEARGTETVRVGGQTFTSRLLRAKLDRVERVFPYVATCGRELDTVALPPDDIVLTFWWDAIKTAVFVNAFTSLRETILRQYLPQSLVQMNPGSGDADVWPIQEQRPLFDLLGGVTERIGVELTSTFLMIPNKSSSGIFFASETDFRTCQVCRRKQCPNRRAPFDVVMWDSIHEQTGG